MNLLTKMQASSTCILTHCAYNLFLTCIARKREMPLSETNLTSIQTNPHHTHLWTCNVCALALHVLLYCPVSCDNQNKVVVVATTVLSRAALGTTLAHPCSITTNPIFRNLQLLRRLIPLRCTSSLISRMLELGEHVLCAYLRVK
jgi:hypothetical protein